MHVLTNWKAKRAGGRITVYGTGEDGKETKIVGVDEISLMEISAQDKLMIVVAIDKHGTHHRLIV